MSLRDITLWRDSTGISNVESIFTPDLLRDKQYCYFDCGVKLDKEVTEIKAERYKLLQNFVDNMIWLEKHFQNIKAINSSVKKLNTVVAGGKVALLDTKVGELKEKKSAFIRELTTDQAWKNSKFSITLDLLDLNAAMEKTLQEYNDKYVKEHQLLHDKRMELKNRLQNYRFIALIEQLERIKFPGLVKMAVIQNKINSLTVCTVSLSVEPSLLTECNSCGYLPEVMEKVEAAEPMWDETVGRIESLVEKYIEKLEELLDSNQVKSIYGKYDNLLEFIKSKHPDKETSVRNLFALLRDSWQDNVEQITHD